MDVADVVHDYGANAGKLPLGIQLGQNSFNKFPREIVRCCGVGGSELDELPKGGEKMSEAATVVNEAVTAVSEVFLHFPLLLMLPLLLFVLFFSVRILLRMVIEPYRTQSIDFDDSDSYSIEEIGGSERSEPHVCEDDTNSVLLASLASSILFHNIFHRHD